MIVDSSTENIVLAAAVLRGGGLVAFPTETVYGLGADASNRKAVARIFAAKGRPCDHPLIVHLAETGALERWARDIPPVAWRLAERFWPGPLTLILKRAPGVADEVTGGQDTIGVRVPGHPVALALLRAFGGGVAAPSANRFGRLSPTAALHVRDEIGGAVDCILDGGECVVGIESTILDLTAERPRLLRPGVIHGEDLAAVLGAFPVGRLGDAPRVPGEMPSHYAPGAPLRLAGRDELERTVRALRATHGAVAVLAMISAPEGQTAGWRQMPGEPELYARELYARLREADASGSRFIVVERPPAVASWEAVCDRLERAARGSCRPSPHQTHSR